MGEEAIANTKTDRRASIAGAQINLSSRSSDPPPLPLRYERPQNGMSSTQPTSSTSSSAPPGKATTSATMDSVMRLMTGQQERGIRDKLNDSNRPTWEQYKKDNADKLDLTGKDEREMEEYRRQLDREREERLRGRDRGGKKDKKKKNKKDKKKKKVRITQRNQ